MLYTLALCYYMLKDGSNQIIVLYIEKTDEKNLD